MCVFFVFFLGGGEGGGGPVFFSLSPPSDFFLSFVHYFKLQLMCCVVFEPVFPHEGLAKNRTKSEAA